MQEAVDEAGRDRDAATSATWLACLIRIGQVNGLTLTRDQIVRDNLLPDDRLDRDTLLRCARRAGLRCSALTLPFPRLLDLGAALPAIALLNDGAAILIETIERAGTEVLVRAQDPRRPGEARLFDGPAFAAEATGEVILIRPDHADRTADRPFGFALIASLMLADRRLVIDMAVSALLISGLALTPIVFWTLLGSSVLPSSAANTFTFLCSAAGLLILFEGAFSALRRSALVRLTARVDEGLSAFMIQRLLALPIEFFETTPVGTIAHTVAQMAKVRSFLTGQLFAALLDGGVLVVFVPVMIAVSPLLTLVVVGVVGLIMAWIVLMLPGYRRRSDAVDRAESDRGAFLSQTVQGIRTVKTLALDARQAERWDALTAEASRLRLAESRHRNLIQSVVTPLERLSLSGTIAVGVYVALVDRSAVGVGALLTFIMLTQRVAAPLLQLSQLVQQFDEARNAVARVGGLLNQPGEEGRSGHGVRAPVVGSVAFSGLRFRYRGAASLALKDVSFTIRPGMSFGIMGRSGSGKTTITRLLQRLHADYQGTIRVDGVDVREYDVDHLRASLGVVLQDNFLFSGTIRDTIAAAKSDASLDEVVRAARLAGAEEFIDKLPRGYETVIYEGSPNLSGGQRQRLAIARALITDPKILILDEATSALDAESEAIVNANLSRMAEGRTTIVISHRLSSLVACDAILVLDAGEVHDIGTHAELLDRCDIYSGLWARQNAHAGTPAVPLPDNRPVQRLTRGARG